MPFSPIPHRVTGSFNLPHSDSDERRDDVAEIERLMDDLGRAVTNGDAAALESLLSREVQAVFTGGAAPVSGRSAVVETWRRHLAAWQDVAIHRRGTAVRIHGDVAWARFLWDGEGSADGRRYRLEGERWTIVIVWEEGEWRLAQTHSSMPHTDWESHRV